ncbi:MAG: Sec-independent protein translocase protein TatB [Paracoccaceae bacterium]
MFDIGWTELLVIGVVALIVVGPKDLPGMFRTLGRFTAKARSMAREFSRAMEEAADETGVGDVAKDLKKMTSAKSLGLDRIKDAATKFEDWDPMAKKPSTAKGPATEALSEERAEAARKIHAATAKKATERLAREAKEAAGTASATGKKPAAKPAKKTPVKPAAKRAAKPAAKKPTVKKPAAKKPAAKKITAKKPATKKLAAKRSAK